MSFAASTNPTPYDEVNALLLLLLTRVQAILREKLVGCYLYGSLSLGDFDPESSDIDFLIVTTENLTGNVLEELRSMHADIAASGLPYARRLEGSYIQRVALRRYDPRNASHPTLGIDWDFHVGQHGSNWIIERYIVREHGVIVWGPSPKTLIDPVPMQAIKAAVCETIRTFWTAQLAGSEWLRPREYQAFAILTMCRALYTLQQGVVASKPAAAAWACQAIDAKWRPTVERALIWRTQHIKDDLSETLDFLRFAIAYSEELCG